MNTVERAVNAWASQPLVHGSDAYIRALGDLHAEACKYGFLYVADRYAYPDEEGVTPHSAVKSFETELRDEFNFFFGN